jgi:hypothetical protein
LEPLEDGKLSVFPNPAKSILNLKFSKAPESTLKITDATGRMMFIQDVSEMAEYKLDVGKFAKGVYLVTLTSAKEQHFAKFVVE